MEVGGLEWKVQWASEQVAWLLSLKGSDEKNYNQALPNPQLGSVFLKQSSLLPLPVALSQAPTQRPPIIGEEDHAPHSAVTAVTQAWRRLSVPMLYLERFQSEWEGFVASSSGHNKTRPSRQDGVVS